ncbi:MAG: hypothetical protein OXN81_04100 [Alphaproteobacteria bacterium]|nr:hypothetical protein [Alphaproteobacteria bacterium]
MRPALALLAAALMAGGATASVTADDGAAKSGAGIWPDHAAPDGAVAREGRAAMPFTTDQIEALGRLLRETQQAIARAADAPPEGRIRQVRIGAPGDGAIPAIAVRKGYVTAVTFADATGAPWPIEDVLVDRGFLPAAAGGESEDGSEAGHVLYLAPQARALHGNAVVKLRGLAEPLALNLRGGGGAADFRVEVRLSLHGPNAVPETPAAAGFHAGDPVLLGLLGGIAPPGAERLSIEGGGRDDRVWRFDGELLLVTGAHLLSPGPWAAERGAGGRWAYRLPDTPYALVTRDGRETRLAFRQREAVPVFPENGSGGLGDDD